MRKNTILLTFAILLPLILNAGVRDFIPLPADSSKIISLDGTWPFKLLAGNELAGNEEFYKPDFDCSGWQRIRVPGCWDAMGLIEPKYIKPYDNTGLYKMNFEMPASWKGKKVTIFTEGVLMAYEMWVNGTHVGEWTLAHNGNMIDISDFVTVGKNDISICVRTDSVDSQFDINDDWNSAGINRSIKVFAVPDNYVSDIHITSKLAAGGSADVTFDVTAEAVGGSFFKAVVKDSHGDVVHEFTLPVQGGDTFHHVWHVTEPRLWTAETPCLYTLEYSVGKGKKLKDGTSYQQRFGIREVRVDGTRLLVNNVPVKLRGVCYHESDYRNGKMITDSLMLKDMALMKMGNINFIRCSHYPKGDRFYELCDSLGFYVMNEVPMGFGEDLLVKPELKDNQILRAEATVAADKNHPCVIVRSIGNENQFGEIYENTGRHVKEIDPSIPICYPLVGSYFDMLDYDIPDFVDIYTPHYPTPEVLKGYISRNDKPMILTEYCHSFGSSLEDHDVLWELIRNNESLAGGAVWHWNDQGMICKGVFPGKYAWTTDIWTNENTYISLGKLDGNDGIVYPTRDLHPDFFNVRRNYCPVRFLTDKVVPVPSGYMTASRMDFEVENRYDFLNLKDNVEILWELTDYDDGDIPMFNGRIIMPDCEPGEKCTLSVIADLQDHELYNWLLLRLKVIDKVSGESINEMNYLLNDESAFRKIFTKMLMVKSDRRAKDYLAEFPLWRAGRKPMLPDCSKEVTRTKEPVTPSLEGYLLFPSDVVDNHYSFTNDKLSFEGDIDIVENDKELDVSFDMHADRSGVALPAAGIAMLLDKDLRYFQWFGQGPYPSWPGKDNANVLDRHSMQAGDLYFEGDRMGVNMLLCTDVKGNGIIIVSDCGNYNFEETDRGVVVSVDPVLSGLGPKFGPSAHVSHSSEGTPVAATLRIIPVSADGWSENMTDFFRSADSIGKYNPFVTAYDIYLNRFPEK